MASTRTVVLGNLPPDVKATLQMNSEPPDTSTIVITVNCPGLYWSSYYDTELEYSWRSPGHSYTDTSHRMLRH